MLMQGYKVGDTLTIKGPDGSQAHGKITSITDKQVRIAWAAPDEVRIMRDTQTAARAFEEVRV